ncbi:MAG TPA: glycosyltransferase family 1 protein, partial [Chitinophagaceae bacterium]
MEKSNNIFSDQVLICLSHLRWNFVYQRPQHLMARFAQLMTVYFVEEPVFGDHRDEYRIERQGNVFVVVPCLSAEGDAQTIPVRLNKVLHQLIASEDISRYILWYYTPMALRFTNDLAPSLVVYDCMDELSAFRFAPPELKDLERQMFEKADIVFTGGRSLYDRKKEWHHNIYPLPSSIDRDHFAQARNIPRDPADQADIPRPRFGFYGVIDERFDIDLIAAVAAEKRGWHFILVGPVVKIDPDILPQRSNIHYTGSRGYAELPAYLAGWDIAIIPFVRNESTEFISPTKTPEYLAAGKPVISTSIKDVVDPYEVNGLVRIADDPDNFIAAAEAILANGMGANWARDVELFLSGTSWDRTWT